MHTFTDAAGRTWSLTLDLQAAFRIDDLQLTCRTRPVVFSEPDDWLFDELLISPRLQAGVVWGIVADQAAAATLCREDFQHGLTPVVMRNVVPLLLAACADFFQCCPTSLSRLLRAQEASAVEMVAASDALLTDDATPATTSPASPPAPASTGEPPASPSAS